jgi:hypothetical protein
MNRTTLFALAAILAAAGCSSSDNGAAPGAGGSGAANAAGTGGTAGSGGTSAAGTGGAAAAGAGGSGGGSGGTDGGAQGAVPAAGMFVWTVGGETLSASNADLPLSASYIEGVANGAKAMTLIISGRLKTGESCQLTGQFEALPPPAGVYPIVANAIDGSFTAACSSGTVANGANASAFVSRSGQVVLTKSDVGDIAGTFAMQAAPLLPLNSPATAYSGGFNEPCAYANTNAQCAAHAAGSGGTCADLLACCNGSALKAICMPSYTAYMTNGDVACGNFLAVNKSSLCP